VPKVRVLSLQVLSVVESLHVLLVVVSVYPLVSFSHSIRHGGQGPDLAPECVAHALGQEPNLSDRVLLVVEFFTLRFGDSALHGDLATLNQRNNRGLE
jgi:hypothetical protein